MPRLQVALDVTSLEKALFIAKEASKAGAHLVEAGTPLIKSVGMGAIKTLKREVRKPIVADMKTIDAGRIEAALVADAGGDYITVLALADIATLEDVVEEATRRNLGVFADLLGVMDIDKRIIMLEKVGISNIIVHVGVDVQKARGVDVHWMKSTVFSLSQRGFTVAIAGGITPQTAPIYIEAGADIIIVGGYIYNAPDPYMRTRKLIELL